MLRNFRRAICTLAVMGSVVVPGATVSAAPKAKPVIELIPGDATDPYYLTMVRGAKAEAKALGVTLKWTASPTWNASNEAAILQTVIAQKPSAIAITPSSATSLNSEIKSAIKDKISVAAVDAGVTGNVPLVSTVQMKGNAGGALGAKVMAQLTGEKGQVYVADADAGDPTEIPRLQGFLNAVKKNYSNMSYTGVEYNNDSTSTAASQLQAALLRYPNLTGVFATNSYSGMGVGQELKALGKTGKVKVVAYDAEPAEVQYLKEGLFQALIVQQPYEEGVLVVKYLVEHLDGKKVPKSASLSPVVVTQKNLNQPSIQSLLYKS